MSDGPLGPGQCIEEGLRAASDLLYSSGGLFNADHFINPQAGIIAGMFSSSADASDRVGLYRAYLESIHPPPPNLTALLQQVDDFQAARSSLDASIRSYQSWTDFISGKLSRFPGFGSNGLNAALLFSNRPEIPAEHLALLAGFGFVGLWGMIKGGNVSAYAKCELDPNDPCAKINKILGALAGMFNTILNTIIDGMNTMIDFANKIMDYITQVLAFIENIVAIIVEAVAELINMLLKGLHDGLARLLGLLRLDPCFAAIIQNCISPELQAVLPNV